MRAGAEGTNDRADPGYGDQRFKLLPAVRTVEFIKWHILSQ